MSAATPRVWWSYLGDTYRACSKGGSIWAPWAPDHLITQVQPGDVVVHEYRRKIVSLSRVLITAEFLLIPGCGLDTSGGKQVWRLHAAYEPLARPVPFVPIRQALLEVEPEAGPAHAALGSGRPGDLYPFNTAGLAIVLEAAGSSTARPRSARSHL